MYLSLQQVGQVSIKNIVQHYIFINPFVPNALFLYPLKTSENRKRFFSGRYFTNGCLIREVLSATGCLLHQQ